MTNIPDATARDVITLYAKRWWIEIVIKELKSVVGLGQSHITKDHLRVERSFAIAFFAYLTLVKFRAKDISPNKPWGLLTLKYNFSLQIFKDQVLHSTKERLAKSLTFSNAA